jgi:ribosomal subunit interface protein
LQSRKYRVSLHTLSPLPVEEAYRRAPPEEPSLARILSACRGFIHPLQESAMVTPLHIKFLNIPASEAIEAEVRKRAEKLQQFSDRINRCDVTIETNGKHKHQGHLYEVRIDLTLPGAEIALNRIHPNEDVYVAIRDAFDAAIRKLQEHLHMQRGEVKTHEA